VQALLNFSSFEVRIKMRTQKPTLGIRLDEELLKGREKGARRSSTVLIVSEGHFQRKDQLNLTVLSLK
jgi:hypothetical protein